MKRSARLVPLLFLVLAACGGMGRGEWDPFRSDAEGQLSIFIRNDNAVPVTVRALSGGSWVDIGTIDPRGRRTVSLAWDDRDTVRFRLEVLGGRSHTTSSLLVASGDHLELWITNPVQRSIVRR